MSRRTQRSIWTFLSQEFLTIVTLLVAMVATPLILHWLGDERFGAFETVAEWAGYLALLEFGIGEAIQALLARACSNGDEGAVRQVLFAALRLYWRVALLMIAVGGAATAVIAHLIPVGTHYVKDLRVAWLIGVLGTSLLPFSALRILAQVEQRGYWINTLLVVQWALVTGLSIVLAWLGWGITGQAIAMLLGTVVFNLALAIAEKARLPGLLKGAIRAASDKTTQAAISELRWPGLVFNLCGRFSYLTDNIIIAYVLSPAVVVPFFITQRLTSIATRELQAVGGASWAALTELHNQGKNQQFNARLIELTHLVAILAVGGLVPVVAYNHFFVERWVGSSRYGGNALTIIAAVNALLLATFSLWTWVVNSTGQVRSILPITSSQTILNLSASIAFTYKFGIIGPVLGSLVAFCAVSIWWLPLLLAQLFNTKPWELILAFIQPVLLGVPYGISVYVFAARFGAAEWFTMGWQMSAAAGGYWLVAALILLTKSQRAEWVARIRLTLTGAVV
ncbi:MAG: hypothetical protein WCA22_07385 [Candidatus Binatus sp.]